MSQPAADLADRMAALRAQGIHSVLATFTDLNGGVKGKLVPLELLPQAVAEGAGFSGPSITGTGLPRRPLRHCLAPLLTGQAQSLKARLGWVGPRAATAQTVNRDLP